MKRNKPKFITKEDSLRILETYPRTKLVYDFIKEHPNTDAREIAAGLGEKQVYVHVNRLEDYGLVSVQKQKERHYTVKHYNVTELNTEQTSNVPPQQRTEPVAQKVEKTRMKDDELRQQYESLKRKGIFFDDRIEDIAPDMDFLLTINGVDCVPKGTLVAVSGEKGTGKSSVMAVLAGVFISDCEFAGIKRKKECNNILWIDTEKDKGDNRRKLSITRHVAQIADGDSLQEHGIDFVRMKGVRPELLRYTIEVLADEKMYDVIIIDGIIEMTDKPNENYRQVIDLLMQLSEKGSTIIGMLHTSMKKGDDNMMYALGTHFTFKASTGFLIKNNKSGIITMSNNFSNDTETIPNVMLVNKEGMIEPYAQNEHDNSKEHENRRDNVKTDRRTLKNIQIFKNILSDGILQSRTELVDALKENGVTQNNAYKLIRQMVDMKIIAKENAGKYGKYYLVVV